MPYWLFLKKWQNLKLSSAANYRWRFKGYGPPAQVWSVVHLTLQWPCHLFFIANLADHGSDVALQVLKVQFGQWPSFTSMEHHVPYTIATFVHDHKLKSCKREPTAAP